MSLRAAIRLLAPLVLIVPLTAGLSACTTGLDGFVDTHVEGYDIDNDALTQIRPGQSQALVVTVLGSPQFTNDFGTESAFYYMSKRVSQNVLTVALSADSWLKSWLGTPITVRPEADFAVWSFSSPSY